MYCDGSQLSPSLISLCPVAPSPWQILSPHSCPLFSLWHIDFHQGRACDHGLELDTGAWWAHCWVHKEGWWLNLVQNQWTFRGTTKGTDLLCSFWSLKNKVFIIKMFNVTVKYFKIAFTSTVWKSCRDRAKTFGYSGPRDSHSNTIKCPLRLLQPKAHTVCLLYPLPSPVFPLPFIVFTWRKNLQDNHCAPCPSAWLRTRLSCDETQVVLS